MKPKFLFVFLLTATSLLSHHKTADYYDTTRPVTLKGIVREFVRANPHSFILLDVKNPDGTAETWAVEGDGPNNLVATGWDLRASGWSTNMAMPSETIGVTAFPARPGVNLAATLTIDEAKMPPALVTAMKQVATIQKAGRLVHGIDVTLADGRKLLFGEAGR
jgi:hypothetical protein